MGNEEKKIRCTCGKLVAISKNGRIFVYCKSCKRQVEIATPKSISAAVPKEPRA